MAKHKPLRANDTTMVSQIAASEEIDGKIYVSGPNKVLGRVTTGDGPHEEIDFGDLPAAAATILDITYADMETALAGSTLAKGQFYRITDASGTDLGFVCQAIRENEISVNGTGGYLNADFQEVGNYDGVEAITGEAFGVQKGIWRFGFEAVAIAYTNLSGGAFAVGDTITGGTTGATAVIVTDDGASGMTAYMTSSGVAFDGSEVLDNGGGVTADMDGAAGSPDIAQGDVVIWNLLHWQLVDAAALDGTDPETNTAAYTQLLKTDTDQGYLEVWDISEFDFENNWLQYRADLRGNLIRYSKGIDDQNFGYGFSIIPFFQWGNESWYGNESNDGAIYQPNSVGFQASGNILHAGAFVADNVADNLHYFQANVMFQFSEYRYNNLMATGNHTAYRQNTHQAFSSFNSNTIGNRNEVTNNTLLLGASIVSVTIGNSAILNVAINNNILENGGTITGITTGAGCSISNNKIGQGAAFGAGTTLADSCEMIGNELGPDAIVENLTMGESGVFSTNVLGAAATVDTVSIDDGASVEKIVLSSDVAFSNKTIEAGVFFASVTLGVSSDETETISANVEIKRAEPGYSDVPASIEIDGVTTLDITAAFAQYRGIINVTSPNATEEIDAITNPPTLFPFTIRPEAGLVLTITGTAYSGIAAGQIALKATDYVLDGDKGEYIVLEIDPLGSGCLVEKLVVNGIV